MTILASEPQGSATSHLTESIAADRDRIMHALAVAETIVSLLPVMPFHLDTDCHAFGFNGKHGVRAMLPAGTTDFGNVQAELGGVQTLEIDAVPGGDSRRLMLSGSYLGVPFQISATQYGGKPELAA